MNDAVVRQHASTATATFDDAGLSAVVLDERDGRVHRLNAEATAVWLLCDGTLRRSQIPHELALIFDAPVDVVLPAATGALAELDRLKLLATDEDAPAKDDAVLLPRPPDP